MATKCQANCSQSSDKALHGTLTTQAILCDGDVVRTLFGLMSDLHTYVAIYCFGKDANVPQTVAVWKGLSLIKFQSRTIPVMWYHQLVANLELWAISVVYRPSMRELADKGHGWLHSNCCIPGNLAPLRHVAGFGEVQKG